MPIPADGQALNVQCVSRAIEDSLASLGEHRNPRRLAVRDVQGTGRDNGVLDVLNSVGADRFVVDGETPARDPSNFDPGFAASAFGTMYLAEVQTRGASSEKLRRHVLIEPVSDCLSGMSVPARRSAPCGPKTSPTTVLHGTVADAGWI